jgi:hypothetical protein
MKIIITRSDDFRRAVAIKTGAEVPESVEVEIAPATLPEDLRPLFLRNTTFVQATQGLEFSQDYAVTPKTKTDYYGYGNVRFMWDSLASPNASDIIAAIRAAVESIAEKKAKADLEAVEREAKRQRDAERRAIADEVYGDELKRLRAIEQLWDALPDDAQACARKRVSD